MSAFPVILSVAKDLACPIELRWIRFEIPIGAGRSFPRIKSGVRMAAHAAVGDLAEPGR